MVKISAAHRRDFSCYLRWYQEWDHTFCPFEKYVFHKGDQKTIECFARKESDGQREFQPKHPRLLAAVFTGKDLLNFQIKQWAECVADASLIAWTVGLESIVELKVAFPWLPLWVWKAVENAARRNPQTRTGKIRFEDWEKERCAFI